MKNLNVVKIIVLVMISSVMICIGQEDASKTDKLLNQQIAFPHNFERDEYTLFNYSVSKAGLPGGIVFTDCKQSQVKTVSLSPKTSLANVLKHIESNYPEYKWEISEGVLNLLSRNSVSTLLEMPIKEFKAENITAAEALNILLNKPEVKQKKVELGLDRAVFRLHIPMAYYPNKIIRSEESKFNYNYEDKTFRQILNIIAKNKGQKIWFYTEKHCGKSKEFSIFFKD
jgi:hypothetical protein